MTRYASEVPRVLAELQKNTRSLLEVLFYIQYQMRGGITRNEALQLTPGERDLYLEQIEQQKEIERKSAGL